MSVLSEWDIINELGRGIFIYPFQGKDKSISGGCLCLTASEYSYIFSPKNKDTQRLSIQSDPNSSNQFFQIPSGKTAVVWTHESIFINGYFCGSIHSKVKLVSKGIGHIGTRVNPNWGGILAIALHNLSDEDVRIDISETIAYLRFYRVNSQSSYSQKMGHSGKLHDAIPEGCPIPSELNSWISDRNNQWRTGDKDAIWKVLKMSPEYQEAQNELKSKSIRYRFIFKYLPQWDAVVWWTAIGATAALLTAVITAIQVFKPLQPSSNTPRTSTPKMQE